MIRRILTALLIGTMLTAGGAPAVQAGDGHRGWRGGHEWRHDGWRRDEWRHDGWRHDGRHHDGWRRDAWRGHRGDYRHDYRHHHRRSDRKKSKDYSDEILIGAGIVGLAIIAGSMMSSNSREPDITWSDPPRRDPVCDTDVVSRTLPDGRVQYGDRTRCY